MCPDAPKMSHTACLAGLVGDGGSVDAGRWTFGNGKPDEDCGRATSSAGESLLCLDILRHSVFAL